MKNLPAFHAMAAMGMGIHRHATGMLTSEKPSRKCLLPGCEEQTQHNGGYCCAEHCRQHNDPCGGCVHDGKSSCMDRPCEGCPHEKHQLNKE